MKWFSKPMSNEIELYQKLNERLPAMERFGQILAKSGMYGCSNTEQGIVIGMNACMEGKTPNQLNREYHIIEGRLGDRADALLAKFIDRGGKHEIVKRTPDECSVKLTTSTGQSYTSTLTWTEAKAEPFVNDSKGGLKKNWRTPRARMQTMWARVISDAVRTLDPRIPCGIGCVEELEDDAGSSPATPRLDLPSPASTPVTVTPEPTPTPKTIDVAATVTVTPAETDEQAEAKMGLAPEVVTPPAGIDATLTGDLEKAIGDFAPRAVKWMIAQAWIKPGDGLDKLSPVQARRIIKNTDTFRRAVLGTTGETK